MARRDAGAILSLIICRLGAGAEKKCPLQENISLPKSDKLLLLRGIGA
jgi:hypothetical protein